MASKETTFSSNGIFESRRSALEIRSMQPQDIEQVHAIDQISFSMPWPMSSYRFELFENPLSLLLVAEETLSSDEKNIVAMIVVWLIMGEAHIATIAVHPDRRGEGIASLLLARALQDAIQKGAYEATLEVRAGNLAAQKLYRRFHFQVVGERPRYYRDNNEDALIMTVTNLNDTYLAWLDSIVHDLTQAKPAFETD